MEDIRTMWNILKFWKDMETEYPGKTGNQIKKAKVRIREYYKEQERSKSPFLRNVIQDEYGYYEKIVIPVWDSDTLEELEEYFKDVYYIPYHDRGYDCTGQLFTSWYRIFKVTGNWIIYHRVDADI